MNDSFQKVEEYEEDESVLHEKMVIWRNRLLFALGIIILVLFLYFSQSGWLEHHSGFGRDVDKQRIIGAWSLVSATNYWDQTTRRALGKLDIPDQSSLTFTTNALLRWQWGKDSVFTMPYELRAGRLFLPDSVYFDEDEEARTNLDWELMYEFKDQDRKLYLKTGTHYCLEKME